VLAQWYSEEGGYVDLARQRARGTAEGEFGQGVQAVLSAVEQARQELDERFSRALVKWVEAGRPASQVLPMDQALKRVGARFLQQAEPRKLLVLLVDGMAWAQAVELLESLGSRAPAWGPSSWHAAKEGRITDSQRYPVVLANLPTMTETSRSAFFAGVPMAPGEAGDSSKDPQRFAAHKELRALSKGSAGPRLLLRSTGHTSLGVLSSEALNLVRDTTERVVGIVINAIDDSLKSSTQEVQRWNVDSIRSLGDLLDCARDAGRAVLLASDHGHVPGDRLQNVGACPTGGARWRVWAAPDAQVKPHEVAFSGPGVHTPKGAHGVVLLANDATSYGGSAHAGEHGGATLAEVVAPCLLLAFDDPLQRGADGDKALVPTGAFVPEWWHYELNIRQAPVEETPKPPPSRQKRHQAPEEQLALLAMPPEQAAAPPRPPRAPPSSIPPPDMSSPFAQCEMLQVRAARAADKKLVVQAVEYLLLRGGLVPGDAFATALGYLPFRVRGLVSSLQEVLNVDGYAVLTFDPLGKLVRLDREKLEQQFEVKV
jgi:hypothetical protein